MDPEGTAATLTSVDPRKGKATHFSLAANACERAWLPAPEPTAWWNLQGVEVRQETAGLRRTLASAKRFSSACSSEEAGLGFFAGTPGGSFLGAFCSLHLKQSGLYPVEVAMFAIPAFARFFLV
eukprot:4472357-Amphidinium_carterae.2